MAWQTPKTNWGQPGQTVPIADDFNRIEGNIQHLQDTKETPAGAQAKANTAEANAKAYTDAHEQKAAPHSGHETPAGAQAKADAAAGAVQAELDAHKAATASAVSTVNNSLNNHISSIGTTANYGHCKTINNLTRSSFVNGEALSAYQGKLLREIADAGYYMRDSSGLTVPGSSIQTFANVTYNKGSGYDKWFTMGTITINPQNKAFCFMDITKDVDSADSIKAVRLIDASSAIYFEGDLNAKGSRTILRNLISTLGKTSLPLTIQGYSTLSATATWILSNIKLLEAKQGIWS
jgi:hypothetical protein